MRRLTANCGRMSTAYPTRLSYEIVERVGIATSSLLMDLNALQATVLAQPRDVKKDLLARVATNQPLRVPSFTSPIRRPSTRDPRETAVSEILVSSD